jgi:hypothetical protein
MEQIRQIIVNVLNCDEDTLSAVMNKLTELDVTSVNDLVEVQVGDLTPVPPLPVPARRLVRKWSNPNPPHESTVVVQLSSAATSPALGVQPSSSSAALPSTSTTPLASIHPTGHRTLICTSVLVRWRKIMTC